MSTQNHLFNQEQIQVSKISSSLLLLGCPPHFLPSNYLRFTPLVYSHPDTHKPSFLHADICFYLHTPSACSVPPPYFSGHTGACFLGLSMPPAGLQSGSAPEEFPSEKLQLCQIKGQQHLGKMVIQGKSCVITISVSQYQVYIAYI